MEEKRLTRRDFLKVVGLGTGALLTNSLIGECLGSIEPSSLEEIEGCLSEYIIAWQARPWVWVNLTIASSFIDGLVIKPGEWFSLNKALRFEEMNNVSRENTDPSVGYVAAQMSDILKLDGWAYGLCLGSTAIFRAALNSPLLIPERHTHYDIYPDYFKMMPVGTDAAIFKPDSQDELPESDLKLFNPTMGVVNLHFSIYDLFGNRIFPPNRELSLLSYKAVYLEHLVRIVRKNLAEKGANFPRQFIPEDTLGNRRIFVRAAFSGQVSPYNVNLSPVRRDKDGNYVFERTLSFGDGRIFRERFVSEYKN